MEDAPTLLHADVAARLRFAIARLNRQLRQQSVADMTLSQWSALVTVEQHGPIRIGDVADREGVSAPTATRLVASLEERGLLQRSADTNDRRSSYVTITDQGRSQLDVARQSTTAVLARRLSRLEQADVQRLVDVLPLLETLVDADD